MALCLQIHLVAILELLALAGVESGIGEVGVRDWSRAVDEACTKRINYFNDQPFWRVSTRPVLTVESGPFHILHVFVFTIPR